MNFDAVKKFLKFPVIFIIFGVMTFGFFCMGTGTFTGNVGNYNHQMFLQKSQPCCNATSIFEHVNLWKNTSLATPQTTNIFLPTIAFWLVLAFVFYKIAVRQASNPALLYRQQNPNTLLFNNLGLALSKGLLKPKIY